MIIISVLFVVFVFKFDSFAAGFSWVGSVSAPLICGIVIAYIMNPLVKMLENKVFKGIRDGKPAAAKKQPSVNESKLVKTIKKHSKTPEQKQKSRRVLARALSIVLAYIIVLAAIAGIFIAIVPSVTKSVVDLIDQMPDYLERAEGWVLDIFSNNPDISKFVMGEFNDIADLVEQIAGAVKPMAGNILGNVSSGIFKAAGALFTSLKNLVIGLIIAIYLLYSKEHMLAQVKKIFFAFFKQERCQRIFRAAGKANRIFTQYIISNLMDSLLIMVLMLIGMLIMGMPYSSLVAVVCGVTNLIPFFGPFIGAIPCAVLILLADPIKVIWFAIYVLILQQLDGNVIKPLLFGESVGLPAIWVLVSITVGGGMFGIVGMLLGVPVFAVFYLLFSEFVSDKLKKKDLPGSTADYEDTIDNFSERFLNTEKKTE